MSANDLRIVRFEELHRTDVIDLWKACGLFRPWNDPNKDIDRCLSVASSELFVLLEGDRLVGSVMAGYDGHRGAIYYLSVDPAEQGKGYGKELMDHCEAFLTGLGCPKINLFVRKGNEPVLRFYDTIGFELETSAALGKRLIPDN